jgi:hypothetical protein
METRLMFPLALVFTACLATEPSSCREVVLPVDGFSTSMQCLMGAQPVLAQWQAYNPSLMVRDFRCMEASRLPRGA